MRFKVREGLEIGDGCPAFVIAEIGSNWRTLEDCLNSIALARACGADAAKFQLYDANALYGFGVLSALDSGPPAGVMDPAWIPKLGVDAKARGIEFMCSAFSPELLDIVDPHVNLHKVASAELTHVRMLERLNKICKPVILSTGASGDADIRGALQILNPPGNSLPPPVALLYCVSAYPARRVDLRNIDRMRKAFSVPVGFSDHTIDVIEYPKRAVSLGACILEKHVNFVGADGPDAPHSLTTDEFKTYVQAAKWIDFPVAGRPKEEEAMVLRHNRRLIATRAIAAGAPFVEGQNFGVYRSLKDDTRALHPFAIEGLVGKVAKRDIQAGDGIGPGDL